MILVLYDIKKVSIFLAYTDKLLPFVNVSNIQIIYIAYQFSVKKKKTSLYLMFLSN